MTKEFVPYELAVKLKQLGFDEPCISHYTAYGKFSNDYSAPRKYNSEFELGSYISAPLFQQSFRWFRDEHFLEGITQRAEAWRWYKFWVYELLEGEKTMISDGIGFNTYEEAELACLDKLIDIITKQQEQ
jgi:hypothetical protein